VLSHHFGRADRPTQARLFIPTSFALSMLAIYLLSDLEKLVEARLLLIVFAVLTFHHRQYAVQDPLTAQLTMTREVKHIREFLSVDNRPGDLWVYDRPGQLSAMGLSAISWNKFKDDNHSYLENLRVGLYNRVLIIERPAYKHKLEGEFALQRSGYRLVPLREHELTPDEELRISVLELTPGVVVAPQPPAAAPFPSTAATASSATITMGGGTTPRK
jgi:hypothetical protein